MKRENRLVIMDPYYTHLGPLISETLRNIGAKPLLIPGGCTKYL